MPNPESVSETNPVHHRNVDVDTPHARPAEDRLAADEKPDQLAKKEAKSEDRQEALIDEAVEETFPASDPVSAKRIT